MRAQFALSEIGVGLRRNLTMTVAVVISVAVALALAGASLLVRAQVDSMKGYWYDRAEVDIYFCTRADALYTPQCVAGAATDRQIAEVKAELDKMAVVRSSTFLSATEGYRRWKAMNPDNQLAAVVGPEAIQQAWQVRLTDPAKYDLIRSAFTGQPGVHSVADQRSVMENVFLLLNALQTAALLLTGLMLSIALLLIVNTVRVSAHSRRRETGIMRLVGASNFYVQIPFVAEAVFAALLGAALASGLLLAGHYVISHLIGSRIAFIHLIGISAVWSVIPLLVLAGTGMAAGAALVTLRKHLKV
ncbi:cell division protein FtsX [Kitasatospora sp. MMS16-BH015]|uniref:permease-like cell division protein FtsX n=1 Tax=Kitasatospora sp. MMS16-BH015 TaxID=2018025 RepID=UPI000CA15578|nr:permease-like cell division protein FtsX [Kitasatospora sp. MMS16-BH015]AUG80994.1 cell division protein FtsX [Kitasatospora sp. MMS16-BH015]